MLQSIFFIISFLLVSLSAFFVSSFFNSADRKNNVLFFILTCLSQIIIQIELLSILKAVSAAGVLFINFAFFIVCFVIWTVLKQPKIDFPRPSNIINVLGNIKKDRILLIISIFFKLKVYNIKMIKNSYYLLSLYTIVNDCDY